MPDDTTYKPEPENQVSDEYNEIMNPGNADGQTVDTRLAQPDRDAIAELAKQHVQSFLSNKSIALFPDDFLIINDVILTDVPATAIKTTSPTDVFVGETLRTKAPVIDPLGRRDFTVFLSLVFPPGEPQSVKLRRLIAELSRHPLVYIYNNKIRRDLGIGVNTSREIKEDDTENTIFVLESGTLRSSNETVGAIILELTLHYFNHKPFSHHFWYNAEIGRASQDINLQDLRASRLNQQDEDEINLDISDLRGYEARSHTLSYLAEKTIEDLRTSLLAIDPDDKLANAPVPFPYLSKAWLYYADHLEKRYTPLIQHHSSDFVGLEVDKYEQYSPPTRKERAGSGNLFDFIGKSVSYPEPPKIYQADETWDEAGKTTSEKKAEKTAEYSNKLVAEQKETRIVGQQVYNRWQDARKALIDAKGIGPWQTQGQLDPGVHLSAEILAGPDGYIYHYKGASKCNIMAFETLYRSGYKVPLRRAKGGRGYKYPGVASGPNSIIKQASQDRLNWGIRKSHLDKESLNAIIDSGVPLIVAFENAYSRRSHVVIATKIRKIEHYKNPAEKGYLIKNIELIGVDQHNQGRPQGFKRPAERDGRPAAGWIEIIQPLPSERKDVEEGQRNTAPKEPDPGRIDTSKPQNTEARRKWKKTVEDAYNVKYYDKDPKVRNVFVRQIRRDIDGDIAAQRSVRVGEKENRYLLNNIVCSSISISFGHRVAPIKLRGQDTCTWQFLGAGNKTGAMVFTFAGPEGREAANQIKKLVYHAQENARLYSSAIKEAGSLKVHYRNHELNTVNSILALLSVDNIVVSEMSEQTVSDSTDKHQLVIQFLVQDFEEERFQKRFMTQFDTKKQIVSKLMSFLKPKNVQITSAVPFVNQTTTKSQVEITVSPQIASTRLGRNDTYRFYKTKEGVPTWLANAVIKAKEVCDRANRAAPPSAWKVAENSEETWRDRYADWGADKVIVGHVDNIHSAERNRRAVKSYSVAKGQAIKENKVIQESIDRENRNDFDYNGAPKTNQEHVAVYNQWLDEMAPVIDLVKKGLSDEENFRKYFGSLGEEMIDAVISDLGGCYNDLLLPQIPGGNTPLPPEFYIYNDSTENSALSSLTDNRNLQMLTEFHLNNELQSAKHFLSKTLLGGSYLSHNLPRILANRRGYNQQTGAEQAFLSSGEWFLAGLNPWEPVHYRYDDLNLSDQNTKLWATLVTESESEGDANQAIDKFITKTTRLSHYLNAGREWMAPYNDTLVPDQDIARRIYGEDYNRLSFGPNPKFALADKVLDGQAPTRGDFLFAQEEDAARARSRETGQPENIPNTSIYVANNSAVIGSLTEEGRQAEQNQGVLGTIGNILADATPAVFFYRLASRAIRLAQQHIPDKASFLREFKHYLSEKGYNEIKSNAKMISGIALGNRANDLSIRRVFPTFKIYFIEDDDGETEVSSGRILRAFDDFYSYSAIQEIRITRSRKVPADLAVIRMTNVGGLLYRKRFGDKDKQEEEDNEYSTGIYADTDKENPFEKMILQDGVKVQIRIGYANQPDLLESAFLGQVVEIAPSEDGKILEIMCQGYGAELDAVELGPLEDGPVYYSSQMALSSAIIQNHIVSFGRHSRFARYNLAEIRNKYMGGDGHGIFSNLNPVHLIETWSRSELRAMLDQYQFKNHPQDDNIYAPPPQLYTSEWERFWDNACIYRPLKQTTWDIFKEHELRHPGFISLAVPYGHSPRMTMYFGSKGQHYWAHPPSGLELFLTENFSNEIARMRGISAKALSESDVFRQQIEKIAVSNPRVANAMLNGLVHNLAPRSVGFEIGKLFGRYKPFRNYHYFDDKHHIIHNEIRTSRDGTFNEVEISYFDDEGQLNPGSFALKSTVGSTLATLISNDEATKSLLENLQSLQHGGEGLLTVKLDENIPKEQIRSYRQEFPSCITSDMARRYAQGLFARLLRDAYKGELVVVGKENIKPFDVVYLKDDSIQMTGPIEVESVTHIFNADHGFISVITPDLCLDINEYFNASIFTAMASATAWVYGIGDIDQVTNLMLMSPITLLGAFAGVKLARWTEDGTPVFATPLTLGGKPFISTILGPKNASIFLNMYGHWHQYWDDLDNAWRKLDVAEELFHLSLDAKEWLYNVVAGAPELTPYGE